MTNDATASPPRSLRGPGLVLAPRGVPVIVLGLLLTVAGVLAENPPIAAWGESILAVTAALWLWSEARAGGLQGSLSVVDVDLHSAAGPVLARRPAEISLTVAGREDAQGAPVGVTVHVGSGLAPPEPADVSVGTPASVATRALQAGPIFIHGVDVAIAMAGGLFRAVTYVPVGREFRILPRSGPLRRGRLLGRADLRASVLAARTHVRGQGSDVRELREHVAGDPFKHIAWKASARRGRLIVREFEEETTASVYILLDVGPGMRVGPVGQTRLDGAIDECLGLAVALLNRRDRVGLCTYDRDVLGFTRADSGPGALDPIVTHLGEAHAVVAAESTECGIDQVAHRLAAHVEDHDGQRFRLPGALGLGLLGGDVDVSRLHDYLWQRRSGTAAGDVDAIRTTPAPSVDAVDRDLRAECRRRGVELPFRADLPGEDRSAGLLAAIDRCVRDRSSSHVLWVVTDVADLTTSELAPAVRLSRAHRHELIVHCPAAPPEAHEQAHSDRDLDGVLGLLFDDARRERRKSAAIALTRLGARISLAPGS